MKTLVTGASGFVGSAVLRKLLDAGHDVRALVRPSSDHRNLAGLDVELCEGDLGDPGSLRRAVTGCNRLFHVAADYRLWIPNPDYMYNINVVGTASLLRSAAEAGVGKIVYTMNRHRLFRKRSSVTTNDRNTWRNRKS
jgi:dihydroflavonol-4-reductase